MKRKLIIMGIIILLISTGAISVLATMTPTVRLVCDKVEVKTGEEISVILKVSCEDGINGIDTTYSYDTEKLELISATIADSNFASLGSGNQITVINNSTDTIKEADIYQITLKVKESAEVGSVASVELSEILLDSDVGNNSSYTIPNQKLTFTISDSVTENTEQEDKDREQNSSVDDKKEEEGYEPSRGDEEEDKNIIDDGVESTEGVVENANKDNTIIEKEIPKAGKGTALILVLIIVIAIVIYRKNKKYLDIN